MSANNAPLPWQHIYKTLKQYAPLWGGAAVLFTCLGMACALFGRDYWAASQPLVLRDEATGSVERLGRFGSQSQMKAAQETILEMATNYDVVRAALQQVGPESGAPDPDWPTADYVNAVANKRVTVRAPEGSEFGSTEVIYLSVQATTPERSRQFCSAVYESLTARLRTVRRLRADSIMDELIQSRDLARQKWDEAAARLREIEVAFGSDLGELRNLSETFGDGTNRRVLDETQRELQAAELELEQLESLHSLLVGGREDPNRLLVSGGELLSSQPSLLKMKDGLIEAQLQQSQLSGRYTSQHPRLRAAIETEREIRQQIRLESAVVVEAMQPTLQLGRDKVKRLRDKQAQLTARLEKVAGVRTQYAGLAAEVKHRTMLLEAAEKALTEAQASRAASLSVNLLAEVGPPVVSDSPVGASGSLLTLGSATAGLMFGLGAVFLIAPGPNQVGRGRRWSDIIGGRRATDRAASDGSPADTSVPSDRRLDRRAADRPIGNQPVVPGNHPASSPTDSSLTSPDAISAAAVPPPASEATTATIEPTELTEPLAEAAQPADAERMEDAALLEIAEVTENAERTEESASMADVERTEDADMALTADSGLQPIVYRDVYDEASEPAETAALDDGWADQDEASVLQTKPLDDEDEDGRAEAAENSAEGSQGESQPPSSTLTFSQMSKLLGAASQRFPRRSAKEPTRRIVGPVLPCRDVTDSAGVSVAARIVYKRFP